MILYTKPDGITTTDMMIWIDSKETFSESDIIQFYWYSYYLSKCHARKYNWFYNHAELENFSLFCATELYLRYFKSNYTVKVKNIGNYISYVLPRYKSMYVSLFCTEYDDFQMTENCISKSSYYFNGDYVMQLQKFLHCEFGIFLEQISSVVKFNVERICPYYSAKIRRDIYISVMLTMVSDFIELKRLWKPYESEKSYQRLRREIIKQATKQSYLFHLNSDMNSYIRLLTTMIKASLSIELTEYLTASDSTNDLYRRLRDEK